MKSKFVLAQLASVGDPAVNLEKAKKAIARAYEEHRPDVIVFPECFMSFFPLNTPLETVLSVSEPLDGPFVTALRQEAKKYGMWVICGICETTGDPDDRRRYNTVVVINGEGELAGVYRKTHLYDAFGHRESDSNKPGDRFFEPIDTPFGKLGLFVCYEVRFPEVARYQRAKGADIIVMPTAWAAGKIKSRHFHTLINARAIENAVYMLACDQCNEASIGESVIVDPMGIPVACAGEGECLIAATVDTDRIEEVRRKVPSFESRRPDLYTV